jgi:hypothetical protein
LVDVSGHRWWALRAGAVSALVAGLLTVSPNPAHAQNPDVRLAGIGNVELRVGGSAQSVNLVVENKGDAPAVAVKLTMTVPLVDLGVHIASAPPGECALTANDTRMDCTIAQIGPGQQWTGVAQVGVHGNSSLQAGESRNGTSEVSLTGGDRQTFNVKVNGPERAAAVEEVSGIVTDELTGEPISGATVLLADSQNGEFSTTTNGNGEYRFAGEEIAPGSIGLRASKEGYQGLDNIQNAQAGQKLTGIQLTLRSTASPTPSASPTPTATPGATPTSTAVPPPLDEPGSGMSFFTKLMITLGILLVLLGIAAIAYLIWRRRRELREDGPEGAAFPTSGPRGPAPRPGSHGVYHPAPTQVIGGARTQVIGGGPTQVARPGGGPPLPAVGPQPALAEAPTMLHRAGAADETAMIPRAGGPPGPRPPVGPGGPPPPVGPGGPPPPRPAAPPPAYGAETYAEPQGRHAGGYGEEPSGYGGRPYPESPAQPGRAYGSPAPAGASYGSPAGPPPAAGPTSAGPPASRGGQGYDPQSYGSYGPDPYAQPRGDYGQPSPHRPGYDQTGYGPPGGGYSETGHPGGGRHGAPEPGYGEPGYAPPARPGYTPPPQPGYTPPPQPGYTPPPQPGYTPPPQPGYTPPPQPGQPPGHGQPGYREAYGQPGRADHGQAAGPQDYDTDYYDESGRPRHEAPAERRRLDWLDD